MRLIIPAKFYVEGGVERVMLSLIKELDNLVEVIVILLPQSAIADFQEHLKGTTRVVYEPIEWPSNSLNSKKLQLLARLDKVANKIKATALTQWIKHVAKQIKSSSRVCFIAEKYQCTHCVYFITNRVPPPTGITIPVASLTHDLFWHFAPLTYTQEFVRRYDESLFRWLQSSNLVITVSHKTRNDLLSRFPGFEHKVRAIPLASDGNCDLEKPWNAQSLLSTHGMDEFDTPTFFYPSSFSLYKDHLTLMSAAIRLAQQDDRFQIVLTGKDTDLLARGTLQMTKQTKASEYAPYLQRLRQLYFASMDTWNSLVYGFGYCDFSVVEATYQLCDCVVMPSRYEGFGLAISEAVVRGIPVIAADLDVFREQVELYQCADRVTFFPAGDSEALQTCLKAFLDSPVRRLTGSEISARFGHWTWRRVAEEYISVLSALCTVGIVRPEGGSREAAHPPAKD